MYFKPLFLIILLGAATYANSQQQSPSQYQPKPPEHQPERQTFDVDESELKKFAKAAKDAESLREESREKISELTEKYGVSINEYRRMQRIADDPTRRGRLSEEEIENINTFGEKLRDLQQEMDAKVQDKVQEAGLDMQRYRQILSAIQRDKDMRLQVNNYIEQEKD